MSREWTLGEVFVLRHAGFPFDWLEGLGVSEAFLEEVGALLALEQELVALAGEGGAKAAERVQAELRRGRAPQKPARAGADFPARVEAWSARRRAVEAGFTAERQRLRRRLHALAGDLQVQEAVFLSSPDMFDNVWSRYLAEPDRADNADARRVERQVYSYLQRFCAKNETTSFFGPMGYGEVEGEGTIELVRLPEARRRRTFFAVWALQELARGVGRDKALQGHLPLRVNPIFTFGEDRADCASLGLSVALGPQERRVLEALRTPRSTVELAADLGVEPPAALRMALPLLKVAAVVRGLQFGTHAFEVFDHLRAAVAALPAGEAREGWLAKLDRLDGLRAAFEGAGFPERRERLLALEAAFTEATGVPARRGEGKMYSDRLVIYEEGGSPFRLRVGTAFAQELAQRLGPGLELSAAFGEEVQRGYRQAVREKLGAQTEVLDFLGYASRLRPDGVTGSEFSPVAPVPIPPATGAVQRLEALPLSPSTPGGRFALPDVCIGGRLTPDGRVEGANVLLARVHHHLLLWNWLCAFYEDRPRMERVAGDWLAAEPSARNLTALALSRRNKGFYAFPGRKVAYTAADALELGEDGLKAAELSVRVNAEGPALFDAQGNRLQLYLPLADFSTYPPFAALAHPLVLHAPLRSGEAHVPRVELGEATYQRARWEVDLAALSRTNGLELFLEVQREAAAHGWPRFLFGRVVSERKPILLDTRSPFAAELLRHLVHQDTRVIFEEMLPGPDELWLQDARGRYTFELRVQAQRTGAGDPAGVS
jgi:hypothetical protein